MKKKTTKNEFRLAEKKINELFSIATKKGGFDFLTKKESSDLHKYTELVKEYEETHYTIELPQTLQ